MATLFDDASLVMIPSGYKDDKLYSIKPVEELGNDVIINGSFATDSDWTKGTGWTISGGTANCDGTQTGTTNLNNTAGNGLVNGKKYKVIYTISNYSAGSIRIKLGNTGYGVYHSANGTYIQEIIAGVTTFPTAQFNADSDFVGSIDNVSVKEITANGDFTFSRDGSGASPATRVNSAGFIEKGRTNLSLYSNTFSSWTAQSGGSVTSGQSGYDGTNNAWLLTSGASTYSRIERTISHTGVYTISVYAKAGTLGWLSFENSGITSDETYFDLVNGTTGTDGSNVIHSKIESVGNGWWRCSATLNGTSNVQRIYPAVGNGDLNSAQGNIYIQNFQFEKGLVATNYIATTTAAASAGILGDMPRLDYSGGATCPSLLLEPSRTNKVASSEFVKSSTLGWALENGAVITNNYAISPEGVQNAMRAQLDNSGPNSLTRFWTQFTPDASNDTASFYAKSNTGSSFDIVIYFRDAGFGAVRGSKTITLTNEWQRFDLTANCSAASGNVMFLIYNTSASGNWDFLVYGIQVEGGSYPTSYIPTHGSATARGVDAFTKTGISSLINSQEGTLFVEMAALSNNTGTSLLSLSDGSPTNNVYIGYTSTTNQISAVIYAGGSAQAAINIFSYDVKQSNKIAFSYKSNEVKLYINGSLAGTDTSATMPSANSLNEFSSDFGQGSFKLAAQLKQAIYFDSALSDAELAALTTL